MFKEKLIMVTGYPPAVHGQATSSKDIHDYFVKKGHIVEVLPLPDPKKNTYKLYKFVCYLNIYLGLLKNTFFKGKIFLYLSPGRSVGGFLRDVPTLLWSKLFTCKTIIHLHGGELFSKNDLMGAGFNRLFKFSYQHIDKLIILSKRLENEIGFKNLFETKTVCIPYGIEVFEGNIEKETDVCQILYLSNLIPSKGYLSVLEVANYLVNVKDCSNVFFNFCGNFVKTPNEQSIGIEEFNTYVESRGLSKFVKYHGEINGVHKNDMLRKSHIFILPTSYPAEAQPISILEAMSFNNVVIATNHRAIPDMVINGYTGYLIQKDDIKLMGEKIEFLVSNPEFLREMRNNSRNHLKTSFSQESYLDKIYLQFK